MRLARENKKRNETGTLNDFDLIPVDIALGCVSVYTPSLALDRRLRGSVVEPRLVRMRVGILFEETATCFRD